MRHKQKKNARRVVHFSYSMHQPWKPSFSPFRTMFFTLSKRQIIISATFILLSDNALNLVTSKILLFGKELKYQSFLMACMVQADVN